MILSNKLILLGISLESGALAALAQDVPIPVQYLGFAIFQPQQRIPANGMPRANYENATKLHHFNLVAGNHNSHRLHIRIRIIHHNAKVPKRILRRRLAIAANVFGNIAMMKAIQIAPNFKPAYELSAQIYDSMGDKARAQQFREAIK